MPRIDGFFKQQNKKTLFIFIKKRKTNPKASPPTSQKKRCKHQIFSFSLIDVWMTKSALYFFTF